MSHAAEVDLSKQDSKTNSDNVKFIAYLDENDRTKNQISKNIDADDLNLFVAISVQGEGKLENAKIEFSNSNFELKDGSNAFEKNIKTIYSEDVISFGLPIVARKNSEYNLSLLNMVSQIKLTGQYTDNSGYVTDINTTKNVNIEWTTNEITEEQVTLSQEVITNRIYNIDGTNKRIVQVLVKSNINESKAPIKTTKIEIQNPEIGTAPEQVKVTAKNTLATNGKSNMEFTNSVDSKYEYNQEEGKTYIEVLNNPNAENNISWTKNTADEFIVTYIYNEETRILPFVSKAKSTLELYGRTNGAIEKENEIKLENIETIGDLYTLETAITDKIYKGNMYIKEDTNYQTTWNVFVSYPELAKEIMLQDITDQETDNISTYYKSTKINKAKAEALLGAEGVIKIYNAEDLNTPIEEINLSEEKSEDIIINYQTEVKEIVIETTGTVKEGNLEVLNEKAIKTLNAKGIEEISKLSSEVGLMVLDKNDEVVTNASKLLNTNLVEPETTIEVNLDKTEISNQVENTLRLTAVLKSVDNSNKLFKNPTINVEFPAEITEVTLLDNIALLFDEELKIKSSEIITNENGIKVLKIELKGEQTKYNNVAQDGATIVADLKLKAENFMANKSVELKATCINGADNVEKIKNLNIVSRTGILSKNSMRIGDNVVENINSNTLISTIKDNSDITIGTKLINNNGQKITNVNIVGTLAEGTILNSAISTNLENVNVYYSTEENAQASSTSWVNAIDNYNNAKSFKIEVGEQEQAAMLELGYKIKIDETSIKEKDQFENNVNINYLLGDQAKQDKITFNLMNMAKGGASEIGGTTQENNIIMSIRPKTTSGTFHEGQIVTYEIKVTNTGAEAINNATLKYEIPEGAVYTELTYAQGSDIEFTDNEELKTKEWNIEKIDPNETIIREVTIKIKEGTDKIGGRAFLESENANAQVETKDVNVEKGDISIFVSRSINSNTTISEESEFEYCIVVKNNTDNIIKNLTIKSKIPDNLSYVEKSENNEAWQYDKDERISSCNVAEIRANETKILRLRVKVEKFPQDIKSAQLYSSVIAKTENGKEYESNIFVSNVEMVRWNLNQVCNNEKEVKEGEQIKYIITAENVGKVEKAITIIDIVPEEVQINEVKVYIDNELYSEIDVFENNEIKIMYPLGINQKITIEIEGTTFDLEDEIQSKVIKNVARIDLGNEEYLDSNEITNTIINEDWVDPNDPGDSDNPGGTDEPGDPDNPGGTDEPEDPNNPGGTDEPDDSDNPDDSKTYSISGLAWLDKDKNGIKNNSEETLKGIEVILLDKEENVVKDKDGKELTTVTDLTGTYKFSNIPNGDYFVVFKYDNTKYTVTKYQVENAKEDENSDAISKQVTVNNKTSLMGITDIIKLEDKNIKNIDIGLIENAKFDLSLEKYVSKVVVTNSSESVNYDFGETNLAKIEIAAKRLAGSTILVQYEIKVSNEGDVQGYVGDVLDYMPEELEFNSEMNPDWYLDTNQILHNKTLEKIAIEPGKTQTVKLVLTKTLSSNSTGTIENTAEIGTVTNLEEIKDIDSTPANKKQGEDDIESASLIISIKTGGPILYIGIVLISLSVLGIGIYLIDKKVLKGGEY